MSGRTRTGRRLGWIAAGLVVVGVAAAGARPREAPPAPYDPAGTLVLFGGYGHLDGRAQPFFQELLAARSDPARTLYRNLNIAMNEALRDASAQAPVNRLTSYPIAVTNEDVKAALGRRLGRAVTDTDVDDLARHFDRVLVLALASALEIETVFSLTTPVGTRHQGLQILGVSALLVSATTGDIVFMVPSIREDSVDFAEPRQRTLEETVRLYESAGRSALRTFLQRLGKRDPAKLFASWDAYMVTDYRLHASVGRSFAEQPLSESRCRDADNGCQTLAALLEYAMSETIANTGQRVLPPVRTSEWSRSADFRIGLTLRANQAVLGTDRLSLRVPAAAATHRVTVKLDGVGSAPQDTRSEVVVRQIFIAQVSASVEDLSGKSRLLVDPVRNSAADRQIVARWVASAPEPSRAAKSAFYSMAILNALKEAEDAMAGR